MDNSPLSKRMKKNRVILQILNSLTDELASSALPHMKEEVIRTLLEIVKNIIYGNVPLTKNQYHSLSQHKKELMNIIDENKPLKYKRKILQNGKGLLKRIIKPSLNLY